METIIYIALLSIIMTGAFIGAYNLLLGSTENILATRIQAEGTFINRKLSWALSGATAVNVSAGGDVLTITRPDLGADSPLVISSTGNSITLKRGSGGVLDLNSQRFAVTNIVFTYIASLNGRPPYVSTSFLIGNKTFTFRNYIRE